MSTATAVNAGAPKKGKKKLIMIVAIAALVLGGGGGAALWTMKKSAADAAEAEADADGEGGRQAHARPAKNDSKAVPTFVALDAFTVNLADRDADRFAQVAVTLEVSDPQVVDRIKVFMPAIRNNLLLVLADRTAADLQGRDGKKQLAEKIRRETSRALGAEIDDEELDAAMEEGDDPKPAVSSKSKSKKKRKKAAPELPIRAVHFANFIVQ